MKHKILVFVVALALVGIPVLAQGNQPHTVMFDGFGFSFDPALAANVNVVQFAGDSVDIAPAWPEALYTQFALYDGQPAPESLFDAVGGVRVYKIADLAGYTEYESRLQQLQSLLADRPDLAQYMAVTENASDIVLPFLPVLPAAQVIRARAQYVETAAVRGISYVTAYRQDAAPFVSTDFLYTFQGISAGGTYYVSAIFRLAAQTFPTEIGPDYNPETFIPQMQDYFTKSITQLNDAAPDQFTPSLTTLDALVNSFTTTQSA